MTLAEAEEFFKEFNCHGYHMFCDEPTKYEKFVALDIPNATKEIWRQEKIYSNLEDLWKNPENVWIAFHRTLEVIMSCSLHPDENAGALLNEMEKMTVLDKKQKILIIETMAGRHISFIDGGCRFICEKTSLAIRMNEIMNRFMDFDCDESDCKDSHGWRDTPGRLADAKSNYRKAYAKFYTK